MLLETERLIIRPTSLDDADFIYELVNTKDWLQFIGDRNVHCKKDAFVYIQDRMLPQLEELGYGNNTLILKDKGVKIGSCGLYKRPGLEHLDIGFAMLPDYIGMGYGYESAKCVLDYALNTIGLKEVHAFTSPHNKASQKLIEKLGLKFVEIRQFQSDNLWFYST